jgi:hypothetical protein
VMLSADCLHCRACGVLVARQGVKVQASHHARSEANAWLLRLNELLIVSVTPPPTRHERHSTHILSKNKLKCARRSCPPVGVSVSPVPVAARQSAESRREPQFSLSQAAQSGVHVVHVNLSLSYLIL